MCAFQLLEHLPYEDSLTAFKEMARVARSNIVLSLPDARRVWRYAVTIPKVGTINWLKPRPSAGPQRHRFDGEHHWEVNKRDYSLEKIIADFSAFARLIKTYRVYENPYHRFFVFAS